MQKSIYFFANKSDLENVLGLLEDVVNVQYVISGLFHEPSVETFSSINTIPDLGTLEVHSETLGPVYLIMAANDKALVEEVPQRRGGVMYEVSQSQNPDSIAFAPGGIFANSFILPGRAFATEYSESQKLMKVFVRLIKKHFRRVQAFWIGPNALLLMKQGVRPTSDAKYTTGYEFSLPE